MMQPDMTRAIEEKIVNGGTYLGSIDWYVPRYDNRHGEGSLVISLKTGRDEYFRCFKFFQCDIEHPKRFIENLPHFDDGDIVQFQAQISPQAGSFARNLKYFGSKDSDHVRRMLLKQEEEFADSSWYTLWGHQRPTSTKIQLKLRRRPRGDK